MPVLQVVELDDGRRGGPYAPGIMQPKRPLLRELTVLDWLGTVVAAFSALGLAMFPLVGRSFAGTFKDLGSSAELPLLTRLTITSWFPLLLAAAVGTALLVGVRGERSLSTRRSWIVGAFLLGCAGFALCLIGVYLPIFSIAGAIKAE